MPFSSWEGVCSRPLTLQFFFSCQVGTNTLSAPGSRKTATHGNSTAEGEMLGAMPVRVVGSEGAISCLRNGPASPAQASRRVMPGRQCQYHGHRHALLPSPTIKHSEHLLGALNCCMCAEASRAKGGRQVLQPESSLHGWRQTFTDHRLCAGSMHSTMQASPEVLPTFNANT